jgi:hypothetical protein
MDKLRVIRAYGGHVDEVAGYNEAINWVHGLINEITEKLDSQ